MNLSKSTSGSRAQQFAARHEVFLGLWAEGYHAFEIARKLDLSPTQLRKHALKAYDDGAPRKGVAYECLYWCDLPSILKKALPCKDEEDLVKVEVEGDGVILTLISATNLDCENVAV